MIPLKPELLHHLPGEDNTSRIVLSNGITLLLFSNPDSAAVVLSGYFQAGSMFDPPEKLGLAYYTSSSLMRGTHHRSFQQMYNELETAGATVGFGSSVHTVGFGGRGLAEDLPLLLDIVADCLLHPEFPPEHVERLRTQLLTGLAIRAQDTAEMSSLTFDELLFAGHPYGLPEDGFPETIQRITREDLIAFHQQHYGPDGLVLVIVGAIRPEEVTALVEEKLGVWQPRPQAQPPRFEPPKPPQATTRRHVFIPGKQQVDLVMGGLGPRRIDPDYLVASLGNNILGQFGMMGRIGESVRENAGLAYYAAAGLNAWTEGGSWEISAGVDPANLERAIDLIRAEIERFTHEPVSAEELSDSQAFFAGRLPLNMESNQGVASSLLNIERFKLGLDYYRNYPQMIASIQPEQILEIARRYLNLDQFVIVSAGPQPT
jgi:zinc protease